MHCRSGASHGSEGAAATEYVFLLVLIALVVVAGIVVYGTVLGGAFEDGAARVESETSA